VWREKEVAPESSSEKQVAIVKPILKTQDAISELESFESMKSRLLVTSDYQSISGKNFIKKSGWRKLALVFNISDQIMESSKSVREDGSFVWSFRVRAQAPNSRFTEAVASCDSRERKFSHIEHDVQATAQTRAKSRAISDLIGAGEVSAEEMLADSHPTSTDLDTNLSEEEKRRAFSLIHPASEIFQSTPVEKKQSLVNEAAVVGETKRFEFAMDQVPYPVRDDEPPFSGFFLGKICKSMTERNPSCFFELERNEEGQLAAIVWHNIDEIQQKEIARTLSWSLRKVAENRATGAP
jgi:hypothetical protein